VGLVAQLHQEIQGQVAAVLLEQGHPAQQAALVLQQLLAPLNIFR
jgi:hypothetical protein